MTFSAACWAQRGGGGGGQPLVSLKQVPVPQPTNVAVYVKDQQALVVLGKALFWDSQAGSDGKTACASCHFHAGADHRVTNILGAPASGSTTVHAEPDRYGVQFSFSPINERRE